MRCSTRSQRGFGLFDACVALALLAFGLLGLVRFQSRLSAQANEASQRTTASLLADELLTAMLVDNANAGCYTIPTVGACGNATAQTWANAWKARALARLPNATTVTSVIDAATSRMTVTLTWYYKESAEMRRHEVSSDIR